MDMFHTPLQLTILPDSGAFSHAEADRVSHLATDGCTIRRIVVDMARADEATTSAFARLVLLRRTLLKAGRDLRLTNLHDRAASLYEVIRLNEVLPKI
jgi:anti-anti-sigma regulatory factor